MPFTTTAPRGPSVWLLVAASEFVYWAGFGPADSSAAGHWIREDVLHFDDRGRDVGVAEDQTGW